MILLKGRIKDVLIFGLGSGFGYGSGYGYGYGYGSGFGNGSGKETNNGLEVIKSNINQETENEY
jgi:Keratin-associated matrix